MKIEVGKFYKTREGKKVRIYAIDGWSDFPIHGAHLCGGNWHPTSWDSNGNFTYEQTQCTSYDIVSEWEEPEERVYGEFKFSVTPDSGSWVLPEKFHYQGYKNLPPIEPTAIRFFTKVETMEDLNKADKVYNHEKRLFETVSPSKAGDARFVGTDLWYYKSGKWISYCSADIPAKLEAGDGLFVSGDQVKLNQINPDLTGKDLSFVSVNGQYLTKSCSHSWKQYNGLMESYQYCEHCDEKK